MVHTTDTYVHKKLKHNPEANPTRQLPFKVCYIAKQMAYIDEANMTSKHPM